MNKQTIYDWPDYYDWTSDGLDGDTMYYTHLANESGGPVLELGCGTGRISLAIASQGIQVIGIDQSEKMLEQAKKKSEMLGLENHVTWIHGDMTRFNLDQQFPLIIIPYRSFLHITSVKEQIRTLKQIRQHLMDAGTFAFNIFVPHLNELISMEGNLNFRGSFPIPGTDDQVEIYDTTEFDHFHQMVYVRRYYERFSKEGISLHRLKTEMKFRYIYPTELNHLLTLCGFRVRKRYGTFTQEIFHSESQELIVEAEKR